MFFELTTVLRESQALELCHRFEADASCEKALCAFEASESERNAIEMDQNLTKIDEKLTFSGRFGAISVPEARASWRAINPNSSTYCKVPRTGARLRSAMCGTPLRLV